MTDYAMERSVTGRLRPRLSVDRALSLAALGFLALIPPTLLAMGLDPRTLDGANLWVKPLKFEVSIALFLGTLAVFAAALPPRVRTAMWFRAYVYVAIVAALGEIVWIIGASAFGMASHFNTDNAFMASVYGLMGLLAVTLTSLSLAMGVAIWRGAEPVLPGALRLSLGLGLVLTFFATVATAGYMAGQTGHVVGATAGEATSGWLFGWVRDGGDLRVAHFFATHAMQVLPALGLAALLLPSRVGTGVVWAGGAAYATLIVVTFVQARAGEPFLPQIL